MAKKKEAKLGTLSNKDIHILKLLKENSEGLRAKTLEKLTDLKGRTLYNHLFKLKEKGFIINIFPIWRLCQNQMSRELWQSILLSDKKQQGHKFSFVLPLIRKPDWWNKRRDRLMKLKEWHYKKDVTWGNNPYQQIKKDDMQIQTYKNAIYFINQKTYFSDNPYLIFNQAKDDVLEAIRFLEEKFRFKFIAEGNLHLTVITNHYVNIKDALSKHCKEINKKFKIKTKEGYNLWVDFSEPLGTESDNPEIMRLFTRELKDRITHPEVPVSSNIWEITSQNTLAIRDLTNITQNLYKSQSLTTSHLNRFGEQLDLHLNVLNRIGKGIDKLGFVVGSISKEHKIMKEKLRKKEQTKLDNFIK